MPSNATDAIAKGAIGGAGAATAMSKPSEYVSFFDRIYDTGLFLISGDDIARMLGLGISLLVATNILYNIGVDIWKRKNKKADG